VLAGVERIVKELETKRNNRKVKVFLKISKEHFLITKFCVLQNKEKFIAEGESKDIHQNEKLSQVICLEV
jgi:hypothetical protein